MQMSDLQSEAQTGRYGERTPSDGSREKRGMSFRDDLGLYQGIPEPDLRTPEAKEEGERVARAASKIGEIALRNLNNV